MATRHSQPRDRVAPARLDLLLRRVALEVDRGFLPSAQCAVAHEGRLLAFETFGAAPGAARYVLQSVGRSVVAGMVWRLMGDGLLDPAWRVGDLVPEFATNGKEVVTLEQVLTHTGGFPNAGIPRDAMG